MPVQAAFPVRFQVHGVAAPEITGIENYIRILDQSGFFEVTSLSEDDRRKLPIKSDILSVCRCLFDLSLCISSRRQIELIALIRQLGDPGHIHGFKGAETGYGVRHDGQAGGREPEGRDRKDSGLLLSYGKK